jgi:hypothetical protein
MCGLLVICGKVSIPSAQGEWALCKASCDVVAKEGLVLCYSFMLHAQRDAFAYNKDNINNLMNFQYKQRCLEYFWRNSQYFAILVNLTLWSTMIITSRIWHNVYSGPYIFPLLYITWVPQLIVTIYPHSINQLVFTMETNCVLWQLRWTVYSNEI